MLEILFHEGLLDFFSVRLSYCISIYCISGCGGRGVYICVMYVCSSAKALLNEKGRHERTLTTICPC